MAIGGTEGRITWGKIGGEFVRFANARLPAGQPPFSVEAGAKDASLPFLNWLNNKRADARENWRRFNKLAADEQLSQDRVEALKDKLRLRYGRYFQDIVGVSDEFKQTFDTNIGVSLPPWDDPAEADLQNAYPKNLGGGLVRCVSCRQALPTDGGSVGCIRKSCGVCSAETAGTISPIVPKTFDCKECSSRLCSRCGGPDTDFECHGCTRIIGLKPKELAGDATFRCWVCLTDQTVVKQQADKNTEKSCRCRNCGKDICIRCAKPFSENPTRRTPTFAPRAAGSPTPQQRTPAMYNIMANWERPYEYPGYEVIPKKPEEPSAPSTTNVGRSLFGTSQNTASAIAPRPTQPTATSPPRLSWNPEPSEISPMVDQQHKGPLRRHVNRLVDLLFPVENYPGSERWKRRAHRLGYVDKRLKDLYSGLTIAQVDFGKEICPPTGYDDAWYVASNSELYTQALELVQKHFCTHDFPKSYKGSAWLEDLGPQFIRYADMVAHGDILVGGYEKILRNKLHRKYLLVGILSQIVMKKIYSELLFGATPDQQAELERQDKTCIDGDGYKRTAARGNFINMVLEHKVLPDHFWPAVDSLAASTTAIFVPLLNLLNYFDPKAQDGGGGIELLAVYDAIHKFLAHAAYYSVCMRRSSTSIFHIRAAAPGARFDDETEGQADKTLYAKSRERAARDEKARDAEHKARRDAWRRVALLGHAGASEGTMAAEAAVGEAEAEARDRREAMLHLRGARVKFAVWPRVTRYRAENVGAPVRRLRRRGARPLPPGLAAGRGFDEVDTQAEVEAGEGQRVTAVGRAMVVYYQGYVHRRPDRASAVGRAVAGLHGNGGDVGDDEYPDDGPRLLVYVRAQADQAARERRMRGRWVRFVLGLAFSVLALLYHQSALQVCRDLVNWAPDAAAVALERARELNPWAWLVPIVIALPFPVARRLLFGAVAVAAVYWVLRTARDSAARRLPGLFGVSGVDSESWFSGLVL